MGGSLFWGLVILVFLAGTAGVGVLSIFLYDFFTQSPYFEAKQITVEGCNHLTQDQVLSLAGLSQGMNILSVNLPGVQRRIASNPWIAEASVRRELPDRLSVRIREREAMALADLGSKFLVDCQGVVFKKYQEGDPDNLPLVTGLSFSDVSVDGEPLKRPMRSILELLTYARDGRNPDLPYGSIRALRVDKDQGVTLLAFRPAVVIRLGYGDYPEKMKRLSVVLENLSAQPDIRPAAIDLVDEDRVVVRPQETIKEKKSRKGRKAV
ncbi:MAG: FtsQ-type POTRA domain-containing protein [Thermodesulfobacteriota bacterium]